MNKKRFLTAVSLTLASSLILTACSAPIHISKTPAADVSADDEIEDDGIIWDEYEESPDAAEADGGYEEGGYEEEGYKEDAYDSGESEETSLKGILYLNRDMRFEENSYSPNDTIYYIGSADIYSLDPETGNSTLVRSFHIEELDNSMFGLTPWVLQNMGFDKNYERMVMDLDNNDGSHHVGWTDQDGNYTDVTAMITAPSSMPMTGVDMFTNSSTDSTKPMKMARPPIRGMGWSWTRRPSFGTSMAPTCSAKRLTGGVIRKATRKAVIMASPARIQSWYCGSIVLSVSGVTQKFGATRPTFL